MDNPHHVFSTEVKSFFSAISDFFLLEAESMETKKNFSCRIGAKKMLTLIAH